MMGFLKTFFPGLVKQEEKTVKVAPKKKITATKTTAKKKTKKTTKKKSKKK